MINKNQSVYTKIQGWIQTQSSLDANFKARAMVTWTDG